MNVLLCDDVEGEVAVGGAKFEVLVAHLDDEV